MTDALQEALELVRSGSAVLVENPASTGVPAFIVVGADAVTPRQLLEIDRYGFGQGYLALSAERCAALGLRPKARKREGDQPNPAESIDAREGIGIGLSAYDRARTITLAASDTSAPTDFVHPGHVTPLAAEQDGTLRRAGATEAAVDLAVLAGGADAAVLWPVLADDGTLPGPSALAEFSERTGLHRVTVHEIVEYRWRLEDTVERIAQANLPTEWGPFEAIGYRERVSGDQHLALVYGSVAGEANVVVSQHEECVFGAALRATTCDCRARLDEALARTTKGPAVLIYSQITSPQRVAACSSEAPSAEERSTRPMMVEHILTDLGVQSVRWLGAPRLDTRPPRRVPVVAVEPYQAGSDSV